MKYATLIAVMAMEATAFAGGYDTPVLHSARHVGMGGTAIAAVDDPSAAFHNPAGLARITRHALLANLSLFSGRVQASPAENVEDITPSTTHIPSLLLSAAFRLTDHLVAGLAAYPISAGRSTYRYEDGGMVENRSEFVLIETSALLALNVDPARLRIGAGYRVTFARVGRYLRTDDNDPDIDLSIRGVSASGFRVGVQWEPVPDHLHVGVVYRHKTITTMRAGQGRLYVPVFDIQGSLVVPARLGLGLRGDYAGVGVAVDLEYAFNSQNASSTFAARLMDTDRAPDIEVENIQNWEDAMTLHVGIEYAMQTRPGIIAPRLGYVFDAKTTSRRYPSAFGTPPTPTHTGTLGIGLDRGAWEVSLAYSYRAGAVRIAPEEIASDECPTCSFGGRYELSAHGVFVDVSCVFD